MRPAEVIDQQRIFGMGITSRIAKGYIKSLVLNLHEDHVEALRGMVEANDELESIEEAAERVAEDYSKRAESATRAAYAFWVSKDMLQVTQYAGDQLSATDRLSHDMLPADIGFCMFEEAPEMDGTLIDADGNELPLKMHTSGYFWQHMTIEGANPTIPGGPPVRIPGIQLTILGSTRFLKDEIYRSLVRSESDPGYADQMMHELKVAFGDAIVREFRFISYDTRIGGPLSNENHHRLFMSLMLMMNQEIVTVTNERPERHFARRAKRYGFPERVNVIRLRRAKHQDRPIGETNVEWSHRWYVRGHWRNQPYGKGRAQTRRIWISDHIKGPEGKPLIITDKVMALVR